MARWIAASLQLPMMVIVTVFHASCSNATSSTCSHVTQYVTTFLAPGTPIVTSSSDLLLRIYVSNPKAAPPVNITVDPSNLTFTLEPGDATHGIVFDGSAALVGSKKQTGAVVVVLTTCSAFPTGVVVHGSFKTKKFSNNTVAAFTVLPVTSLGKDYVTVTHCEQNHCFFGIVATQNQTHVNVTLRLRHSNDVTITPSLTYAGVIYEDGEVIHEVLEPFQAMQVLCYVCDMSGSRVTASFPVAVLSGGEFTTVGNSSTSQDTVLEFLPPTRSLGTLHVVAMDTESSGTMKVVAVHAGTIISTPALSKDNYTADGAGESWTLALPENRVRSTVLTTTLPVLVTLLISHSYDVSGDVRMTLLTPVSQWSKETTYEAVHFFNFEPVHLVLVADFTDLSDCIKIDDELVSDIDETTPLFNPVDGWGEMSVVRVARETGFHHFRLWCDSDSDSCGGRTCKPFWGYMQGMKNTHDRGWALPLGTFSERGQQPSSVIPSPSSYLPSAMSTATALSPPTVINTVTYLEQVTSSEFFPSPTLPEMTPSYFDTLVWHDVSLSTAFHDMTSSFHEPLTSSFFSELTSSDIVSPTSSPAMTPSPFTNVSPQTLEPLIKTETSYSTKRRTTESHTIGLCSCKCQLGSNLKVSFADDNITPLLQTARQRNRKLSATDTRFSAAVIGSGGVFILVALALIIVCTDFATLMGWC